MSEWKDYLLGDISSMKYGSMPKKELIQETGYPIFSGYRITGYYPKFNCEHQEIVVVARGVGGTGDIKISPPKSFITNLSIVVKIDENIVDKKYFFYKFQKHNLRYLDSGSAQSQITIDALKRLSIYIPSLKEQQKVVNILSCLDAKIENLRRQNETLEKIAQTLFKHWFIDFEFPNADGKPYKSSGGVMVPSELGDIPEGWRVGTLKECLEHLIDNRGKTPVFITSGIPALSAKFVKRGEIVNKDNLNYISFDLFDKAEKLKIGDVIMTSEAPLGETYFIAKKTQYYPAQRVFALRANVEIISPSYLNYWLISSRGQFLVQRRASGSTVQGIKQSELYKCEIIIPCKKINDNASELFMTTLLKKELNSDKIQTLTKIRDSLLPKLMSGQIRVQE